ncbi:glycosyltransferase family 4 protein [Actinoplanes rectilineatus]|uniref:glycosyltransferase family 4 protein n=1 Tax=Actinoplanes rectilineatus TaxID=113571 RepID=UPI0005F2F564|nr:glycosyltransferase family 4 protein [Actinoplanes rectilineatus]
MNAATVAALGWRGRHIVICNWRDSGHPSAGGAELYCESVATELHEAGVRVTYLTARAPGQAAVEQTHYGTVVRVGSTYTVYPRALAWLARHRAGIDGIIDSQNGIPFFTPLAIRRRTPIALLIHHVHQDQFAVHFPAPVARIGRFLENQASRWVYTARTMAAVSPSSRAEIRRRLSLRGAVLLAPCGQDMPDRTDRPSANPPGQDTPGRTRSAAANPRIVAVGRLVRQKRVDVLLRALPAVAAAVPGTELHIAGDGEALPELRQLAADLGLGDRVVFHGRVDDTTRDALVGSAWVTASASMGEGWGLSVMEAAAAGVPAVAISVPGLRDTIRPGETGWLVPSVDDLAGGLVEALRTLSDPAVAAEWSRRCTTWAARFTWTATADHLLSALTAERDRLVRRGRERRPITDAATVVTVPATVPPADLGLRVTDRVEVAEGQTKVLLYGADEQDGRRVVERLGLARRGPRVRLARHQDLLGWRTGGRGGL